MARRRWCRTRATPRPASCPGFPARARAIHNAVDLERFDPARIERSEARAELGLDPAGVVLAVVAQLTPWKAQDGAVRIVRLLKDAHPGIRLLLAGSAKFVAGTTRYDNLATCVRLSG